MNTILQQRIEEAAEEIGLSVYNATSENEEWITDACIEAAKESAFEIINNLWISVDEALPEEEKRVLVTHQHGCQVAAFYKDGAHSYWGVAKECPIGASITNWMPIPELKGGEE